MSQYGYFFTGKRKTVDGHLVHEIINIDMLSPQVRYSPFTIGGYIESVHNLDKCSRAWVDQGAVVYGNAVVTGNAYVGENAVVSGNATISGNAVVKGNAVITDQSVITDKTLVCDNAKVSGNSIISGLSGVFDNAVVINSNLSNSVHLYGNIVIENSNLCDTSMKSDTFDFGDNDIVCIHKNNTVIVIDNGFFRRIPYKHELPRNMLDPRRILKRVLNVPDKWLENIDHTNLRGMKDKIKNGMSVENFSKRISNDPIVFMATHNLADKFIKPYVTIKFITTEDNTKLFSHAHVTFNVFQKFGNPRDIKTWLSVVENKTTMSKLITLVLRSELTNKCGLTPGCLKVDDCVFTNDYRLIYTLSLKDELKAIVCD